VIKKRVKKAAVVREEIEHKDKRDRIYGPVTWSADSIDLSSKGAIFECMATLPKTGLEC
jgi:hypothetical protein